MSVGAVRCLRRRNGIIPARMPWVATTDALYRKYAAPIGTMNTQRLSRVFRAARSKSTTHPKNRAQDQLIGANQENENEAHG